MGRELVDGVFQRHAVAGNGRFELAIGRLRKGRPWQHHAGAATSSGRLALTARKKVPRRHKCFRDMELSKRFSFLQLQLATADPGAAGFPPQGSRRCRQVAARWVCAQFQRSWSWSKSPQENGHPSWRWLGQVLGRARPLLFTYRAEVRVGGNKCEAIRKALRPPPVLMHSLPPTAKIGSRLFRSTEEVTNSSKPLMKRIAR